MPKSLQIDPNTSTLIMIDFQGRLMPAIENADNVLKRSLLLAQVAKLLAIPILGTEQSPRSLGNNLESIQKFCSVTISKEHFNACADGLTEALPKGRNQLVLVGCETHVCLMQTALGLIDRDFDIAIVVDGVGSRRALDKELALERLQAAGARLLSSEMLAFEWLTSTHNPHFKEILQLVK